MRVSCRYINRNCAFWPDERSPGQPALLSIDEADLFLNSIPGGSTALCVCLLIRLTDQKHGYGLICSIYA